MKIIFHLSMNLLFLIYYDSIWSFFDNFTFLTPAYTYLDLSEYTFAPNVIYYAELIIFYELLLIKYLTTFFILINLKNLSYISYGVFWSKGIYHFHPVLVGKDYLHFIIYDITEIQSYFFIRSLFIGRLNIRFILIAFTAFLIIRVFRIPVLLLLLNYTVLFKPVGWWSLKSLKHRLMSSLENKKLTFERWHVLYNGGGTTPFSVALLKGVMAGEKVKSGNALFFKTKRAHVHVDHYEFGVKKALNYQKLEQQKSLEEVDISDSFYTIQPTSNIPNGFEDRQIGYSIKNLTSQKISGNSGLIMPKGKIIEVYNSYLEAPVSEVYLSLLAFNGEDGLEKLLNSGMPESWSSFQALHEMHSHKVNDALTEDGLDWKDIIAIMDAHR